jgi:hypothetical protein
LSLALATSVLCVAGFYLGVGLLFAIAFVAFGIARVDSASRGASIGFRLVVLPGVTLLWPLLAWRWLRADRGPPIERSPHIVASRETGAAR